MNSPGLDYFYYRVRSPQTDSDFYRVKSMTFYTQFDDKPRLSFLTSLIYHGYTRPVNGDKEVIRAANFWSYQLHIVQRFVC